jgi:Tfp pilus assembly protein PilN
MLRTNLATRPFYNERLAAILVWGLAAIVVVVTLANIARLISLSGQDAELRAEATQNEQQASELRRQAQQARARVDPAHLRRVALAAREANALIDGRTFSWTELFNRFEATLPAGVRLTSVQPTRAEDGRFVVRVGVVARQVDAIDAFMEALESRGGFRDVLARRESVDEEGRIEAEISGTYVATSASVTDVAAGRDAAGDQPMEARP